MVIDCLCFEGHIHFFALVVALFEGGGRTILQPLLKLLPALAEVVDGRESPLIEVSDSET